MITMSATIHRKPDPRDMRRPWDEGSIYAVRVLNLLFLLNLKSQGVIIIQDVDLYARRIMKDPLLVGQR